MFPATTQHRGPVQHPSDSTAAKLGPQARAAKNYDVTVTNGLNQQSPGMTLTNIIHPKPRRTRQVISLGERN